MIFKISHRTPLDPHRTDVIFKTSLGAPAKARGDKDWYLCTEPCTEACERDGMSMAARAAAAFLSRPPVLRHSGASQTGSSRGVVAVALLR